MLKILVILALQSAVVAADPLIVGTWTFSEIVDPKSDGAGLITETGRLEETAIRFNADGYDFLRKDAAVFKVGFRTISSDEHATVIELVPDYTILDQPPLAGKPEAQAVMRRNLEAMRRQVTIETVPGSIVIRDLSGRKLRYIRKPTP